MMREGQAMARVTHENVITVHEVGIEGSVVFLAQELLDPLDRFLKEMGAKNPETHQKATITRSTLPEETQLLVLDYKR